MKLFGKVLSFMLGTLFALSTSVSAMTFSQPVKMGEIILDTQGIFEIKGSTHNEGKRFTNKNFQRLYSEKNLSLGYIIYDSGIACYGYGNDAIYFHYDSRNGTPRHDRKKGYDILSRLGSKDIKNTVSVDIGIPTKLSVIKTNTGITVYLLQNGDPSGLTGPTHTIIGKCIDGTFVKYIDTRKIKNDFFPQHREYHLSEEVIINEDTIIIPYEGMLENTRGKKGEFRFKWDDTAQWFGVEQVVY